MTPPDSASQFDLAVLGVDDPLGEAVLALLDEHEIPIGHLHALTLNEPDSSVSFQGQDWPMQAAGEFDFSRTQALLVTSRSAAAARLAGEIRARHPAMPVLTVGEIEPAAAEVVARVLKAVATLVGVDSAEAFLALPVAVVGKAGVEELADQSRRLFNLESPEPEAFPLQIAFNLLPYFSGSASIAYESVLSAAAARLSGGIAPGFSVCWAPLFHGAVIALHVRGREKMDADALRTVLRHQEGVTLMETEFPAGTPTPATDALGSQDVFVGRIGISAELIRFWLVFDPNALEAARMVKVVENWIDQPAASVIT